MNILIDKATVRYKFNGDIFIENSNEIEFQLISPALEIEQSQFPISGAKGDKVTFTTILKNKSYGSDIFRINLINDIEAQGYTYIDNSTIIDGCSTIYNPIDGVIIPIINQGESKLIEFKGTVK